jgi:DNA-directed RNA polymerase subunit beta'
MDKNCATRKCRSYGRRSSLRQSKWKIELRQKVSVRIKGEILETTVGRILFNEILPADFGFINEAITSSLIKQLFARAYRTKDTKEVVEMIDAVKDLGFGTGTISGLSFGIFDAKVYPGKQKILKEADKKVAEHEKSFAQGLITAEEKRRLTQEVWIETTKIWRIEPGCWMKPRIRIVIDKAGASIRLSSCSHKRTDC